MWANEGLTLRAVEIIRRLPRRRLMRRSSTGLWIFGNERRRVPAMLQGAVCRSSVNLIMCTGGWRRQMGISHRLTGGAAWPPSRL